MKQRENGIVIGTVIDLDDKEKLGRVRLQLPQYDDEPTSWAFVVSPMAGKDCGFFFRPEKNDQVLVAFENGDPRRPYVLGALWSTVDPPPPRDGNEVQNNWRFIVSRSGHTLKFDDTSGSEKIEIVDKSGSHKIVIDSAKSTIAIECTSGDIKISAPSGSLSIDAQSIDIQATSTMKLQAGAAMTVQGQPVNIN
jgi:uncharacterized protein involved in type VI secretion and phage assembly